MSELAEKSRLYNPPLVEQLSRDGDPKEEKAAKSAMGNFVTDPEGAIYATTSLVPELFAALLKARYSRTELSARQLLWREFVAKKEGIPWADIKNGQAALEEVFNFSRAESVGERILLQYGDDSVFELGGGHIFFDRVSQIAAKRIEDMRIGLSPLEKSTRYVVFDQKDDNGEYSFYKDPRLMESNHKDSYLEATKGCFEFYSTAIPNLSEYFGTQIPITAQMFPDLSNNGAMTPFGDLSDERSIRAANTAYNQSIRAKACDVARVLLPTSTFTNIGVYGNARALSYLFIKSEADSLSEMQMIGDEGTREMKKVLPKFFDVVNNDHGSASQEYLRRTDQELKRKARELFGSERPSEVDRVTLVKMDENPEVNIAAGLLYPYLNLPLKQLVDAIGGMSDQSRGDILHSSLKFRTNRRHKPPRAFEIAGYELVFDILGNCGIYRDLQRQRQLTQQRQNFTTGHGFDMPVEFGEVGMQSEFEAQMDKMNQANQAVGKDFPDEAQYLSTLANYTRWYMGMNLREAFWVTELRSTPQGHFSYRTIAQDMYIKAQEVYPFLKDLEPTEQYVDMSDRSKNLERMEAMQRIQTKLAAVDEIEDRYS